jgi:hypothetical protein
MKRSIYIVMFAFLVTASIIMFSDTPLFATDGPQLTIAQVLESDSDVDTSTAEEDTYSEEAGDSEEETDYEDERDAEEDIESYEEMDAEEGEHEGEEEDSDEAGEEKTSD